MDENQAYTQTSVAIASEVGCHNTYVVQLAKANKIPFVRASNGHYLFPASVAAVVKQERIAGLARRGRHIRTAKAD